MRFKFILILIIVCLSYIATLGKGANNSKLQQFLDSIKGLRYEAIEGDSMRFSEVYQIFLTQPLDHFNPDAGSFEQKIYLSHKDYTKTTLIETEGYAAPNHTKELTYILGANQIIVEHRYFGDSKPDTNDWRFLTIKQAAADHHRVIEIFKNVYSGKWVASGISKGGQTAIYHRYFYPDDVDVSVPYVAPMNLAQEDPRINKFFESVGDAECRTKILEFQKALLTNRDSILVLLEKHKIEKDYEFPMGTELAFEYNVLEYTFAFWQWGYSDCSEIPSPNASPEILFNHLVKASSFNYFTKESCEYLAPFFYQAYTELGYYGYDTRPYAGLLKSIKEEYTSSIFLAPQEADLTFDASIMERVNEWVINEGNNMLFIYGEDDPWSSTAVTIGENTNAVKMIKKDGSHRTRIRSFTGKEKEKIYSTLEKWLGIKLDK